MKRENVPGNKNNTSKELKVWGDNGICCKEQRLCEGKYKRESCMYVITGCWIPHALAPMSSPASSCTTLLISEFHLQWPSLSSLTILFFFPYLSPTGPLHMLLPLARMLPPSLHPLLLIPIHPFCYFRGLASLSCNPQPSQTCWLYALKIICNFLSLIMV